MCVCESQVALPLSYDNQTIRSPHAQTSMYIPPKEFWQHMLGGRFFMYCSLQYIITLSPNPNHLATSHCWWMQCTLHILNIQPTLQFSITQHKDNYITWCKGDIYFKEQLVHEENYPCWGGGGRVARCATETVSTACEAHVYSRLGRLVVVWVS